MKDKIVVYPIIISKDPKDKSVPYIVSIPALNGHTQGTSIEDAIEMSRDYIGLKVMDLIDDGMAVPTSIYDIPKTEPDELSTLVDVNISAYRRQHDSQPVKKTVNIPHYLNERGMESNINFSKLLTQALERKLGVKK
ncbi:type II toxin-antitoxin system HicB family antitoxin [Lentilactobacillus kefiri]|nr:type II toxin-antitoxin system HicB family antitoxin [Lentilactobacillus kefiri]MCJ2162468.1 type II toxin-antitoxin system HicB family antitoxin [Lentilactobacillus kefiri]MCP9369698.1 type II toxin-antitoxin system HicB family antitoxin [Lentilactobacillus kefiri]MDH5109623.1 type II toxin-antitoxin system HicB family antitoxin [Lentilactobacillus kefiri]MDM7494034.1 type II toxin-antitoxin system HicB family antitoxin [Lentilactobacillus kefiri]PAK58907.1 HicB family protein [Lentilactob